MGQTNFTTNSLLWSNLVLSRDLSLILGTILIRLPRWWPPGWPASIEDHADIVLLYLIWSDLIWSMELGQDLLRVKVLGLLSSLIELGGKVAQILSHKRTTSQIVLESLAGTYSFVIIPRRCVSIGNASSAGSIREVASWLKINGAGFEVNEQFWLPSSFIKEKKN